MMEYAIICDVCSYDFDSVNVIPKVLECGHTFCESCIHKLVGSKPFCPSCRSSIKIFKDYPTNYSILQASDNFKSLKYIQSHLVCSVQTMKNKLEAKRDSLTKKNTRITKNLNLIKNGLDQLQELDDSDDDEVNYAKAKEVLEKVTKDFKTIENVVHFSSWKLRVSVSINLNSFETSDAYLEEIYSRLQNDEKIYAVENVDDVAKYGKVTLQNNMILFHALSSTSKPNNSSLIWFDELKQCISEDNFFTFLKLSCNEKSVNHMAIIKMEDSLLTPQFIKLCTGECGPTYKDCSYVKGDHEKFGYSILEVGTYLLNDSPKIGRIDYCLKSESRTHNINFNYFLLLLGEMDGKFSIVQTNDSEITCSNLIGIVVSPTDLDEVISYHDTSKLKIVDCGIIFKL